MNVKSKLSTLFCLGSLVLLFTMEQPVHAITVDELADICEAMESAIQDVHVEYEWYRDPPPKMKEIEGKSLAIGTESRNCQWTSARPFTDRSLTSRAGNLVTEYGDQYHVTTKQSYNGRFGKHLSIVEQSGLPTTQDGTITKNRRFITPRAVTPEAFTILRFGESGTTLSAILRNETPYYQADIEIYDIPDKMNGYNTVHTDIVLHTKKGKKVLLHRIYFSIEHGYTPVRFEESNGRFVADVFELEEVANGLWYPKKGKMKAEGNNYANTYKANMIVVNQGLTDGYFDLEFPPGTKVHDEIADLQYIVKPTEEQFDQWLEEEHAVDQAMLPYKKQADNSPQTNSQADTVQNTTPETLDKNPQPALLKNMEIQAEQPLSKTLIYTLIAALIILIIALALKKSLSRRKDSYE